MKRLHKAIISFAVVAILVSGSSSAFAKSEGAKQRNISGVIVSIDASTRTAAVREYRTGQTVQMKVPVGNFVRTNQLGLTLASFEQLLPGMIIRDVAVR